MSSFDLSSARRVGRNVFLALALITLVEFLVARADVPGLLFLLLVFAAAKAWMIVVYFMHIHQLRGGID